MSKVDILIQINFNMENPEETLIRTNAKREGVEEILATFVQDQAGQGEDKRKPNERDEYKIEIGLDLSYDTFHITSDTGNEGLTLGIVMQVLGILDKLTITELEPVSPAA